MSVFCMVRIEKRSYTLRYNRYLFLPTVDGVNIPGNPLWILNNAPTGLSAIPSSVPLLVGMNAQDGTEVCYPAQFLRTVQGGR